MGKDCGSWIPQQLHFDWQSPNLNSSGAPLDAGKQNDILAYMNSGITMAPRNETMPVNVPSDLPMQLGHSNEPNGWFYCLPRFRQAFMPAQKSTAEEKLPASHVKDLREDIAANGQSGIPQKQFLVIDQSGDQTTFIYSSAFGNPIECLASWQSKLHGPNNLNGDEPSLRRDFYNLKGPTLNDKNDEDQGTDVQSEMHEDTEEINALLYSDSYGYSTEDDDEVTSTGHSPSTMTSHDNEDFFKGSIEEVASSIGKTKKRKLLDRDNYNDIQLLDTASSLNLNKRFNNGDDAESRFSPCNGNNGEGPGETCSLSGNKKMRKERIRDVLGVLQSIIPGGKDKDPVVLLDEAIRCLKSLKDKARALGLDAL